MSEAPAIRCPVCESGLRVSTSTSKSGKLALVLVCSRDGRDFRAFINNKDYIQKVLDSLEAETSSS